ncbi:MAG: hypothetical protein IJ524_03250 [Bacteroidales bacterium]|nr:hypothetical protein [Bacteroidales bacterium]
MESKVIERYNGHVGVSGAYMMEMLGSNMYCQALHRGHIRSLRRGGNGRTALIDWQSMGTKLKARVIEALGCDPAQVSRETLLRSILQRREEQLLDTQAYDYYSRVTGKDGRLLKPEKVTELWNGAKILDAIGELLEEKRRAAEMGRLRLSVKREFEALANEIDRQLVEWPNSLPTSGDRLRKKFNDYQLHGYEVLVHGLTGKESNHKARSVDVNAVVEALIASGAKLNDAQVAKAAETLGVKIDRRRVQEIRTKNATMLAASREGKRAYANTITMQVDRERPDMPLKMWSLDGWTAELYYQDRDARGVNYWHRLVVEIVVDVMNDYPIGYAIGESEDAALITAALQNAVHHTREVLGGYYAPWQIQSDHYALKAMTPKYGALAKYVTPASVGNAKAKPIERYFAYLESEYLWALTNNGGHNITARTQANDEWLNAHKYQFPDREGLEQQIGKIIEIERSRKIAEVREAWARGAEEMRRELNMEGYLLAYGETGRGNMLTPNGLKLIRDGVEYKFDSFDIEMREHRGERWTLRYDLGDMNQALAVSEDGRLRYMVEAKKKVPMALVDYKEEDWKALTEYRQFNRQLTERVTGHVCEVQERAREFVTRAQLESPMSALLLTDSKGQHKDNKRKAQRALAACSRGAIEDVAYEEVGAVEKPAKARAMEDIWDRL